MKKSTRFLLANLFVIVSFTATSQEIKWDNNSLEAVKTTMSIENMSGKQVVKIIKDTNVREFDGPTFVKLKGVDFRNGTIEVNVLSKLSKKANDQSRGFIGIAFRVADNNSKFECIYLRPTNGRAEDQLRRNHSIQYFSYPQFRYDRLRTESAGVYESYADMDLNEWIKMKIEVRNKQARLFLGDNKQPSLIVNDLKLGDNAAGGIGLWVDVGTEGYFSDLKVTNE